MIELRESTTTVVSIFLAAFFAPNRRHYELKRELLQPAELLSKLQVLWLTVYNVMREILKFNLFGGINVIELSPFSCWTTKKSILTKLHLGTAIGVH